MTPKKLAEQDSVRHLAARHAEALRSGTERGLGQAAESQTTRFPPAMPNQHGGFAPECLISTGRQTPQPGQMFRR
jgi:hypothetical protein